MTQFIARDVWWWVGRLGRTSPKGIPIGLQKVHQKMDVHLKVYKPRTDVLGRFGKVLHNGADHRICFLKIGPLTLIAVRGFRERIRRGLHGCRTLRRARRRRELDTFGTILRGKKHLMVQDLRSLGSWSGSFLGSNLAWTGLNCDCSAPVL